MILRRIALGIMVVILGVRFISGEVHAQATSRSVVIINQVRGEECCGAGNLTNLELQLKTTAQLGLPATFVIRYDALSDPRYVSLLKKYQADYPDLIDLGVMIEIIPSLTAAAGVSYKGSEETWYQAHNAFTIGYPRETRKKILDTLFAKYASVIGNNPRVSSSWMLDTDSLNYVQQTYGIQYHQITREQWGTDSYTLYGGPPHFPYPASKNWLMVPDYSRQDAPMIVRQTVTDPIYNYGDSTSSHTTQPNDYMRGGKKIDYFQKLIAQALDSVVNPLGFVCLGLENNMEEKYQVEYVNQLTWIKEYAATHPTTFAKVTDLKNQYIQHKVTAYTGIDNMVKASWITTPNYRVRAIQKDGIVSITDIRVFSPALTDPYNETIAKHEGYWIVPFLIDGSRWYDASGLNYKVFNHIFTPIHNDTTYAPSRIVFSNAKDSELYQITANGFDSVTIGYGTNEIEEQYIAFSQSEIKATEFAESKRPLQITAYTSRKFPVKYAPNSLSWQWEGVAAHAMKAIQQKQIAIISFDATHSETWNTGRYRYYPYAYPESTGRKMSAKNTTISVDNKYAIAGRNPIRLVLQPHDSFNFPIILDDEPEIKTEPATVEVRRLGELRKSQYQYVDLFSGTPTQVDATIVFKQKGDRITKNIVGYIAPNCKIDIKSCLLDPRGTLWFILTKFNDWWRSR